MIKYEKDVKELPDNLCNAEGQWVARGKTKYMFHCRKCDIAFTKVNGPRHMKNIHLQEVQHWVLAKDASLLRHGWTKTHLERYFPQEGHEAGEEEQQGAGEGRSDEHMLPIDATEPRLEVELSATDNLMAVANISRGDSRRLERSFTRAETPPPSVASSSKDIIQGAVAKAQAPFPPRAVSQAGAEPSQQSESTLVSAMVEAFRALSGGGAGAPTRAEPAFPSYCLRQWVQEWSSKDWHQGCRWPCKVKQADKMEIPELTKYLKLRNKTEETIKCYNHGLNNMFSCLEIEKDFSIVGFMASLYETGMAQIIFGLDIFNCERSWTRNTFQAMKHLAKSSLIECTQKGHHQSERSIKLLLSDFIEPKLIQINVEKLAQGHLKEKKDETSLDNLPPAVVMAAAVTEALKDIIACSEALKQGRDGRSACLFILLFLYFGINII